jgi:chromosome partitioning protein
MAIANQKGGVGKTTTAINLGTALAAIDKQVIVIDLDPQGNASTGLGIPPADRHPNTYDVLSGEVPLGAASVETLVPGLHIVPAGVDLSGAEVELVGVERREFFLKTALDRPRTGFDYVLIDCPPALGLLTINALAAADAVLVPLQCEFFALEGVSHLLRTIERVRKTLNPRLRIQGIVLTMYDRRNRLSELVAGDVRAHFGETVYETVIPRNVRVSEAPSHGRPVLIYDTDCAGSRAYLALAGEILRREKRAPELAR